MEELQFYKKNIKIQIIKTDNFNSNTYILEYLSFVIVVDPGETESKKTIEWLLNNNKKIDYCIITHEHFDHNIGYTALVNKFEFKTICSKETSLALNNSKANLSYYYNIPFETKVKNLSNSPGFLKIIKTPGHSKGSLCFLLENLLFSGDTIIKKEFLVTKLPGGNKEDLTESFKKIDKISKMINDLIIFPGHGDFFKYSNFI